MFLILSTFANAMELQVEELPSGDSIVLVQDARSDVVTMEVRFPVGDFSPAWQATHLDEIWSFQAYDPDGALRLRAEALAAEVGSVVSNRSATLGAICLREDMLACATLLGDILHSDALERDELKRHRRTQWGDWEGLLSDPEFVLRQAAEQALFVKGDPRRMDVEKPRRLDLRVARDPSAKEAVLALPNRLMGFSGNLSLDDAVALTALFRLPEPSERGPEWTVELPALSDDVPATVEAELPELTQVHFTMFRAGLVYEDEHVPHQHVAHHVLVGHFYSRMYRALRHDSGLSYGVSGSNFFGLSEPCYRISSSSKVETGDQAIAVMRETMSTYASEGITVEEHEQAVSHLLGLHAIRSSTPWSLTSTALHEVQFGLERDHLGALKRAAAELSVEEINAWIASFYDPEAWSLVVVRPETD